LMNVFETLRSIPQNLDFRILKLYAIMKKTYFILFAIRI
jgi:hypothetical protein